MRHEPRPVLTPAQNEPTRAELAKTPETPAQMMERTRRYFRVMRAARPKYKYARGLDEDANGESMGRDWV